MKQIGEIIEAAFGEMLNEAKKDMSTEREFGGQPWTTDGERGATLVTGLTMRDIRDCYVRAYIMSHPPTPANLLLIEETEKGVDAKLSVASMFDMEGDVDPVAVSQNLCCEIERAMGIFPNIPKVSKESDV